MISSFDFSVLYFIQEHLRCGFLDAVMPYITYLDEMGFIWILIGCVMLIPKKSRKNGIILLAALFIGTFLISEPIKHIVMRPRPFATDGTVALLIHAPSGGSFPSGHSLSSAAAATVISMSDRRFAAPASVLALLIAFSRLYLFVHFPTDVIAGILLGILTGVAVKLAADRILSGKSRESEND